MNGRSGLQNQIPVPTPNFFELQEVVVEIPPVKWTNTLRPSHIIRFHQQRLLQR